MKIIGLFFVLSSMALAPAKAQSILSDWEGNYQGVMIVGSTTRDNDSVDVTFEFQALEGDSVWTYKLTYDSKKFGVVIKDYLVRQVGDSSTDFLMDENDGIIIEMSLMNDCFYDMFEVLGNLYATTLRKTGDDDIQFDLFTSIKEKATVTKSEADAEGNVFEVTSYKPSLHQTIDLHRIK